MGVVLNPRRNHLSRISGKICSWASVSLFITAAKLPVRVPPSSGIIQILVIVPLNVTFADPPLMVLVSVLEIVTRIV